MTVPTIASIALATAIVCSPVATLAADRSQAAISTADDLAADRLSQGQHLRAIAILERELAQNPEDPALLINLGIAHAQRGDAATARESFEAAMSSPESIDLETANGSLMDSRRLARRALAMLDRGEFRPARNVLSMNR